MQQLNITPIVIVSPVTGAVLAEESFGGAIANQVAVLYSPLMSQFLPYLAMHLEEVQKESAMLSTEITEMSKNPDIDVDPALRASLSNLLYRLAKLQTSGLYVDSINRVYSDGEVIGVSVTIKSPILTTSVTCECEKEGTHASVAPKASSLDADFTTLAVSRFSDHLKAREEGMNDSVVTWSSAEKTVSESPVHFNEATIDSIRKDVVDKLESMYQQSGHTVSRLRWALSYLDLDRDDLEDVLVGILQSREEREKLLNLLLGKLKEDEVESWVVHVANIMRRSKVIDIEKAEWGSISRKQLIGLFNFMNNGK